MRRIIGRAEIVGELLLRDVFARNLATSHFLQRTARMYQVEEFREWTAVAALRDDWRRLHAVTPGATFFHSFDWFETYWEYFGRGQSLRILAIREADRVAGIVPLVVLTESSKLGATKVLTYPLAYWGSYYGPIGPRPRELLSAAIGHIAAAPRDWDLFDLRFSPAAAQDVADSFAEMSTAGMTPSPKIVDHTSLIDLGGSFDAYLAGRAAKWRTNYRRWQRRLHECGVVRYVHHCPQGETATGEQPSDAAPRWDLYNDCEKIARRSWQGSSTTGTTLTHESIRPFLRAMHETACRAGAADIHLLYLDDKPLAFLYAYRCRDSMYGLRIGFDSGLSRDGVGNILYMHAIEDSIARGIRTFDLGAGSLKAKEPLRTRIEPIYRLPYANTFSWRGLAWRMKETFNDVDAALAEYAADYAPGAPANAAPSNTAANCDDLLVSPTLVHQQH